MHLQLKGPWIVKLRVKSESDFREVVHTSYRIKFKGMIAQIISLREGDFISGWI